jgi:hypothetical protein
LPTTTETPMRCPGTISLSFAVRDPQRSLRQHHDRILQLSFPSAAAANRSGRHCLSVHAMPT